MGFALYRRNCKTLAAKDSWLLLPMAALDTNALGGIRKEHVFLRFPVGKDKDLEENMMTRLRRLPCIAADILRMTKLE
jgi:hypothetical protein